MLVAQESAVGRRQKPRAVDASFVPRDIVATIAIDVAHLWVL
jgi:hypothetical protein